MATTDTAAPSVEELSPSQRARRERILDAARALAEEGGYDGVQMRDVAEGADVALGTLYRYFPSKVHLLVSVMRREVDGMTGRIDRRPPRGDTPDERVLDVLMSGTRALSREPRLASAMTRALMFADASVAEEVDGVTTTTTRTISQAIAGPDREPDDEDRAAAMVLEQVWFSSILKWQSGRATIDQLEEQLRTATRLLLR